jgi:peptide/nickel transport system substrate-binding protein
MMFRASDWVPASRAVFERFPGYVPRDEPASWMAGGKRMLVDRVEWTLIPDAATAAGALTTGQVDWLQSPISDMVPLLRRSPNVRVELANPLGNIGALRLNHLYPPFNDVRARRAVQMVVNQSDYMQAIVGDDAALWQTLPSFFTPGTAEYTDAGGTALTGPRLLDEARRLLAESGYAGESIVMLVAGDVPITKVQADVTGQILTRIGMKIDYLVTDLNARRTRKDPPDKGGWHIFHTWHEGADCIDPMPYIALRTNGDKAWFGWPKDDAIEALITQWYSVTDLAQSHTLMARINTASMDFVTFVPTGFFRSDQAWRDTLTGVSPAPFPMFWGVGKT